VQEKTAFFPNILYISQDIITQAILREPDLLLIFKQTSPVGSQSDMQLGFCNDSKGECYYRAKKHFREDLILPELLSGNLYNVPEHIFQ
jgi:hypothetical protein